MPGRSALAVGVIVVACYTLGATREVRSQQRAPTHGAPIRDQDHTFRRHVKSWLELRRQNVVMQRRDYSCGAAALATLMRYYWGDAVTETQLLREVVRMLTVEEMKERIENGLSLTDLRRLAVRAGYLATIGRLKFEKLRESKVPLVMGIVVDDFDHFVVYRGTDDYYVYLADPARGNVRTPIPEFLQQWQKNAVLVVVKRGEAGKEPKKTSQLSVRPEEISHGELNRLYVRKRVTSSVKVLPP